ncbi:MarR family winged helix-turn-helix transcriptional regulator [Sulfurimonas sp.]|uniref:MarR family winged helix-turn-helix transcriptional regulator n=1 Tax=Sulfurimonas sp. TaxID=2022749 RepID=UPI003569AB6D
MENKEFNIQESLGFHFTSITVFIKRSIEQLLKPYNLTHLQFSILMNMYKNNISTQKEMLKNTYGDEASITRILDRLEAKGYIKRVRSEEDKRKKKLVLTDEGIELMTEIIKYTGYINNELAKDLKKDEEKEFLRLLQKVHNSLDKI